MKNFLSTLIVWAGVQMLFAQTQVSQSYALNGAKKVVLRLTYATQINIVYTDASDVNISAKVSINEGKNDDKFKLSEQRKDDALTIKADIADVPQISRRYQANYTSSWQEGGMYNTGGYWDREAGVYVRVPSREISVDIFYEIQIPRGIALKVRTLGGDIKLSLLPDMPLDIETQGGDIRLNIPESAKMTAQLDASFGKVYANLPIEVQNKEGKGRKDDSELPEVGDPWFPAKFTAQLNGGSTTKISLKSIWGNIYLKK